MIGLLQKFLVRQRVWMLVGLCLIGITALAVFVIEKAHRQYLELKQTEYIKLTQSAIKVLEHYHSLTVSGELETVQARRLAKRAINTMALDGRNYFYMYNSEHELLISHPFLPETSIYPDDTPEELAESIEVSREAMITAGNNRGWSYPSYTPLAVLADQHENATGFFEYYFYLWGEEKTPIVQRVSDTDIPAFAERKLAYAMPFQPWNWTVITGIYRADEEAAFLNWVRDMVIVSAIILAVIFAFALVISKSITRPLYNIVELMDDIAKGTGDLTRRLDASGRNELARLADGFNQFAEKISGIISCVAVENAVILGLSKDMSENMSQAVARSDRQLSETDQLAQASKDLSESVDNVTDRAVATVQSARATEQSMVDARSTMQKSIESIQALSNSLTVTQDRVSSMEAYSKQVSSVLDVIVTIAEQTNLLALNAAIEAARAGDQGRGFAVVADEVRTLAQRTQTSAAEIDEIISNLQSGTQSVVEAMGDGLSHSQTCVESATQANHVFKDMLTHVQDITEMNQQIASSVEQQSQVAGRILDISHNIAEGSQENLKDVNINLETTNKLTADAEQLDALISSFRYHSE